MNICGEERPNICHCMLYCTYDMLNMFRALLCPSPGALDYMYAIAAYVVQKKCPKHVERIISAIKHTMTSSWLSSLCICNDSWTNKHQVFMNICPVGVVSFRGDGQTDMTKLTVASILQMYLQMVIIL